MGAGMEKRGYGGKVIVARFAVENLETLNVELGTLNWFDSCLPS